MPGQTLRKVGVWSSHYNEEREEVLYSNIHEANIVTSEVWATDPHYPNEHYRNGKHKPVLDIDMPVTLVPSTTPGHFHLYIDKELDWFAYAGLLTALAQCGIIEDGYLGASLQRGYSACRLPWVKKEPTTDDQPF